MRVDSILCVCTGNICRSPLAEGLIKRDLPGVRVSSAGIGAVEGGRMPEPAARIAAREDLDLEAHRGRQITSQILREHELVLVMEEGQKQWLAAEFPQSRGRVFIATHWQRGEDVIDPYRQSEEVFEQVYAVLVDAIGDWTTRLKPARTAAR